MIIWNIDTGDFVYLIPVAIIILGIIIAIIKDMVQARFGNRRKKNDQTRN